MRLLIIGIGLLALGCVSKKWRRETVDATGQSGAHISMQLHVEDAAKTLTVVYEDTANESVRVARRTGTQGNWNGGFTTSVLDADKGRLPASTKAPDGTIWVAYLRGGSSTFKPHGTLVVAHTHPRLGWVKEELMENVTLREPPTIAYDAKSDMIHVVCSRDLHDASFHLVYFQRNVADTTWSTEDLSERDGADPRTGGPSGLGTQPRLLAGAGGLQLFYREGRSQYVTSPIGPGTVWIAGDLVFYDPRYSALDAPTLERVYTPTKWNTSATAHYAVGPAPEAYCPTPSSPPYLGVALSSYTPESPADNRTPTFKVRCGATQTIDGLTPQWHTKLPWTGDHTVVYGEISFAFDGRNQLFLTKYHAVAQGLSVHIYDPDEDEWTPEFADSGPNDRGRYNATVHDPLAEEILIAYQDATEGSVRLATRPAN